MAEDNNQTTGGAAGAASGEQQNQPQFSLQRIYVKDISFESPNSFKRMPYLSSSDR